MLCLEIVGLLDLEKKKIQVFPISSHFSIYWSCDLGHLYKLSFLRMLHMKLFDWPSGFREEDG